MKIKVTLKLGEPLKYEVLGAQGNSCLTKTAAIRRLAEGEAGITAKPEMMQSTTATATVTQKVEGMI